MLFFDSPQSKGLTRYQKILGGCFLGCKNLLNFTCLTLKFHKCHHANDQAFIHTINDSRFQYLIPSTKSKLNSNQKQKVRMPYSETSGVCKITFFLALVLYRTWTSNVQREFQYVNEIALLPSNFNNILIQRLDAIKSFKEERPKTPRFLQKRSF